MEPLKVLIFELCGNTAERLVDGLRCAGFAVDWQLAGSVAELRQWLTVDLDLLLTCYTLPDGNALQVLALLRERGLDIPCIVVAEAIGEERAVECLRCGASDFLLKTSLKRLGEAVRQALADRAQRISKRQEEETLRQLLPQLEQHEAELERFAYTLSHELKTPMVTISSFLGQLEQDLGESCSAEVADDLKFISRAVQTMHLQVGQLLSLARNGRTVENPEPVALNDLLRLVITMLATEIDARAATIEFPQALPIVVGDPVRLREVWRNLIENSLKFSGDRPPRIEVGAKVEGDQALCFVRDQGIGIDPTYHERIFRLFERIPKLPEDSSAGAGLSLVQRILEKHGGRVWVESTGEGAGSTFWFTLPLAAPSVPAGFQPSFLLTPMSNRKDQDV